MFFMLQKYVTNKLYTNLLVSDNYKIIHTNSWQENKVVWYSDIVNDSYEPGWL
jgi:hypothetical protein